MTRLVRLVSVAAFVPALGLAQSRDSTAVIEGHVRDAVDSGAVSYAEVRIGDRFVRSDGQGKYRLTVPPGEREITYRMLGYSPVKLELPFAPGELVKWDIYLDRVPQLLTSMEVRGRSLRVPSGFESVYRRAARGQGLFVTREQIDSVNPRDVLGILHHFSNVKGAYNKSGVVNRIESLRCEDFAILLNGTPVTSNLRVVEELLYSTPPGWIQAVEVYDSRARMPVEFLPACGAVAIWTRTR